GHLHSDEPTSNHGSLLYVFRRTPNGLGIVERAQIMHVSKTRTWDVQRSWPCAGGDDQLLKADFSACFQKEPFPTCVHRRGFTAELDLDSVLSVKVRLDDTDRLRCIFTPVS